MRIGRVRRRRKKLEIRITGYEWFRFWYLWIRIQLLSQAVFQLEFPRRIRTIDPWWNLIRFIDERVSSLSECLTPTECVEFRFSICHSFYQFPFILFAFNAISHSMRPKCGPIVMGAHRERYKCVVKCVLAHLDQNSIREWWITILCTNMSSGTIRAPESNCPLTEYSVNNSLYLDRPSEKNTPSIPFALRMERKSSLSIA